jgi:hypothetical protein
MKLDIQATFHLSKSRIEGLAAAAERAGLNYSGLKDAGQVATSLLIDAMEQVLAERRCRKCGCTQFDACDDGCEWVGTNLCSACKPNRGAESRRLQRRHREAKAAR